MPRITTRFGAFPVMMKPPIETRSPVCMVARVEMFRNVAGATTSRAHDAFPTIV